MDTTLIIVAVVGVAGLALQIVVQSIARGEFKSRCESWLSEAQQGSYRRQTRGAALAELERGLMLAPGSIMLRRLGVMAPLLGVVLTAGSIALGQSTSRLVGIQSDGLSVGVILQSVSPLLAGVTVGALLAIVNQVLMIFLHRAEDQMLREVTELLEPGWFRDTDDRMDLLTDQIQSAGQALDQVVRRLADISSSTIDAVGRLGEAVGTAAGQLSEVTQQLRTVVERPAQQFTEAANLLTDSTAGVVKQYGRLASSLEGVHTQGMEGLAVAQQRQLEAVQQQRELVSTLSNLLGRLEEVRVPQIREDFEAASASARALSESIQRSGEVLVNGGRGVSDQMVRAGEQIQTSIARMQAGIAEFENRWQQANTVIAGASDSRAELQRLRDGLRELVGAVESASRAIQSAAAPGGSSPPPRTGLFGALRGNS